jgi:serine/threonine protein phosphatase 1
MSMQSIFDRLFRRGSEIQPRSARRRLSLPIDPAVIYAIGDVHGCLPLLRDLEARISEDALQHPGEKLIVMLGDYVDRGPLSAQVIDHLLAPPPAGLERICLAGNHESTMLEFVTEPKRNASWLDFGGRETLISYDIDPQDWPVSSIGGRGFRQMLDSRIPAEHLEFLAALPVSLETPSYFFVHAGVQPGLPLDRQSESAFLWWRDDYTADFSDMGKIIVHGHTPLDHPHIGEWRIGVDTGAYYSRRLTAVKLRGPGPQVLSVTGETAREE